MRRAIEDLVLTAAFAAVTAGVVVMSASLSPVARRAPLVVAIPTLLLLLLDLVSQLASTHAGERRGHWWPPGIGTYLVRSTPPGGSPRPDDATEHRRELSLLLWACVLLVLSGVLGMVVGLPVFALTYLRVRSGVTWPVAVAVAAGTWGVLYGLFVLALRIELFEGYLMPWIGQR